jgi:hypothetical protein
MIAPLLHFRKTITVVVLAAGAMDTCSGLLLMLAPALALRLMGVALPVEEALVFIRFIGAFVFSVGALYFYAGQRFVCRGDAAALCLLLVATAWVRSAIFLFTAAAILSGGLSWAWWTVPLTDGGLALLQIIFVWRVRLEKGVSEHGFTA